MKDQYGANCRLHPGAMFKPSDGCPTCEIGGAPYVLDANGFIPEAQTSKQCVFKSGPIKAEFRETCIFIEADNENGDYAEVCLDMTEARDLRDWITGLLGAGETSGDVSALDAFNAFVRKYQLSRETVLALAQGYSNEI